MLFVYVKDAHKAEKFYTQIFIGNSVLMFYLMKNLSM